VTSDTGRQLDAIFSNIALRPISGHFLLPLLKGVQDDPLGFIQRGGVKIRERSGKDGFLVLRYIDNMPIGKYNMRHMARR